MSTTDQRIREAQHSNSPLALSWRRSLDVHQIDPGQPALPRVLPAAQLRDYQAPLVDFMQTARAGMNQLSHQIRDAGYVVLLTDAHAVTVDFIHNDVHDKELQHCGLYLGACWSEDIEGTCAIGVCAIEQAPITVHHDEHYRALNATLTCSSAPVFGSNGDLLAVLDASALHSPHDKRSQHLVLQMVSHTARLVENAYFFRKFESSLILTISERWELMDVDINMLLALDESGKILGANSCARQHFEQVGHTGAGHNRELHGKFLQELVGIDVEELLRMASARQHGPLQLRCIATAKRYFARLRQPKRLSPPQPSDARNATAPARTQMLHELAGSDPQMLSNVLMASRVLNKGISVLLHGETGTGKELFAQAMHQASARCHAPFVALNCAAIPESLIESELFGYRDGAFTGARAKGVKGKIMQADGGTLFLDEIGDMPLALQTRLLRVLAECEVLSLGAERSEHVDLQVICASHRNLQQLVANGEFREDLYFRLSGIAIELPALRNRQDKADLIERLLRSQALAQKRVFMPVLSKEAITLLMDYPWPGNIRQLKNVLQTAIALSENNPIGLEHLPRDLHVHAASILVPQRMAPVFSALIEQSTQAASSNIQAKNNSELLQALLDARWNVSQAARTLGICRATAYRRMVREEITPPNKQ